MATDVLMKLTVHARGEMATKFLEAAKHLGLPPGVVRSQSEGFIIPEEVHRYLFPSAYDDAPPEAPAPAPVFPDPVTNPDSLTEAELEEITKP